MKFRFKPILPDLPENLKWILEGSRIYIDPAYFPFSCAEQLNVLPLLIDKILVFEPSKENLKTWNYPFEMFSSLVEEQVFVPIFLDKNDEVPYRICIYREDLMPNELFFGEYEKAIDEDLNDSTFIQIAESMNLDPDIMAFSLNWDLIVAQILKSPILTTERLGALWLYKFQKMIYEINSITKIPESVKKSNILKSFFYRTIERLPSDLTVDEILEFRSDKAAREFRNWLSNEINKIMGMSKVTEVSFDEELYRDFTDLLDAYKDRINLVSCTITAIVAAIVGILAGPLASLPPIIGPLFFPKLVKAFWKKYGPNNWIFLMLELKNKTRKFNHRLEKHK